MHAKRLKRPERTESASVGVFVFAKDTAPQGLQPFTRIDHDLFVIWDAADPSTDIYLSAAVSVAKALLFRQKVTETQSEGDLQGIELAVNILEKQLKGLEDMETWTIHHPVERRQNCQGDCKDSRDGEGSD